MSRILLLVALALACQAAPLRFRPAQPWLDDKGVAINAHGGGFLYHRGVYWWFGEHMTAGPDGCYMTSIHAYSSRDLYRWKDEGIALAHATGPAGDIGGDSWMERPKVLYNARTGKFVMWFHLWLGKGKDGARAGVAVADRPGGPYRFLYSMRPNAGTWPANVPAEWKKPLNAAERETLGRITLRGGPVPNFPENLVFRRDFERGQDSRDMTLFQDSDGAAYHIFSAEMNGALHVSRLTGDYLKQSGHWTRVLVSGFDEAAAVMKHAGKYYLFTSGCTGWAHNAGRLSIAGSVDGPYQQLGNPWQGPAEKTRTSYETQSTAVLPVEGKPGAFIFAADRWNQSDFIDSRHIWLPVLWRDRRPYLEWMDDWDLGIFDRDPRTRAPR
jgi:hypothetical protein